MVRLTVALQAASARDARDLLETLRFLITSTRIEPGCQRCTVTAETDLTIHYDEWWATEADIRRRVLSADFTSLLSLMECASAPPEVTFDFPSVSRGLDFVAEVRSGGEFEEYAYGLNREG